MVRLLRKSREMGIVRVHKDVRLLRKFEEMATVKLRKDVRLLRNVSMSKVRVRVEFRILGKRLQ